MLCAPRLRGKIVEEEKVSHLVFQQNQMLRSDPDPTPKTFCIFFFVQKNPLLLAIRVNVLCR
jgi:hypothetical protein